MDWLGIQAFFVHICPLIAILAATSASNIWVGASENWNYCMAHWTSGFQFYIPALYKDISSLIVGIRKKLNVI